MVDKSWAPHLLSLTKMQKSEVETHVALVQEGAGHLGLAFWSETFSHLFLQKGEGLQGKHLCSAEGWMMFLHI